VFRREILQLILPLWRNVYAASCVTGLSLNAGFRCRSLGFCVRGLSGAFLIWCIGVFTKVAFLFLFV
jgi:hypothetical protein